MVFYDSLHTGYWRVSLNEQYIWRWLRENDVPLNSCTKLAVGRIAYLVEDRLNTETFKQLINVNEIIKQVFSHIRQTGHEKTESKNST